MSSRRLPGKVLMDLAGQPLLGYVIARAQMVKDAALVAVITSSKPSDDPIAAFAGDIGVETFRGPLDDVAARLLGAAATFSLEAFVRVNADSPLLDPRLIARGIALYRQTGADLVTNVLHRTFPIGMSVEVLDRKRYAEAYAEMNEGDEREHVTCYYYRHPQLFHIVEFENQRDLSDRTLAVDHEADIARIEKIITALDGDHRQYDCAAICAVADRLGALTKWSP